MLGRVLLTPLHFTALQVRTPYATPMSEMSATATSGEQTDSPHIDQHYVYSLRDFQPFESGTYQGRIKRMMSFDWSVATLWHGLKT